MTVQWLCCYSIHHSWATAYHDYYNIIIPLCEDSQHVDFNRVTIEVRKVASMQ